MAANNACSDCGKQREVGYECDSCCRVCRSSRNKKKREEARIVSGKRPRGSGRNPNCSKCGEPKDASFMFSGYCRKCKAVRNKERRLEARLARGQRPLGEGRSLLCYTCKQTKENPDNGYCNACARKKDNKWRLATGRTKRHRTGLCKCGKPFASYSKCYCSECATKWRKNYLANNPEARQKIYDRNNNRRYRSFDEMVKYWARVQTTNSIASGKLKKMPCVACGTTESVQAHHPDYFAPLDVVWLCKKHHDQHHDLEKKLLRIDEFIIENNRTERNNPFIQCRLFHAVDDGELERQPCEKCNKLEKSYLMYDQTSGKVNWLCDIHYLDNLSNEEQKLCQ